MSERKIDRDELLFRLRECIDWDNETAHIYADSALLDFVDDEEVTRAFNNIEKWYA
jgi:hypothetical protein